MTVKISFNGKEVGHILVSWIGLEEHALCEDHHMPDGVDFYKELFTIDTGTIIHDFIEKGINDFKDVTELKCEVKDGLFKYEALNSSGNIVKMFMFPVKYLHTIEASKNEPTIETPPTPMHKYSKEEKKKHR